jgi:hypothetical protein
MAVDRRSDVVAGAVMVGGFPLEHGSVYADFFPVVDGVMAFPGWGPFEGPDSDDLDDEARAHIESVAVPVPAGVAMASVGLSDERRFGVPIVLVCPEYSADDARSWLEAGQIPEVARVEHASFVDIDSGHWPMVSRAVEFAGLLHDVATNGAPAL